MESSGVNEEEEELLFLVVDYGTYSTKSGYSCNNKPAFTIPSTVWILENTENDDNELRASKTEIGQLTDKTTNSRYTKNTYLEKGIIINMDIAELFFHSLFFSYHKVKLEDTGLVFIEEPLTPKANRQRLLQLMFEEFNIAAMFVSNSAILTALAVGIVSGVVIDSGEEETRISLIYDNFCLPHACDRIPYGGLNVTLYLKELLEEELNTTLDIERVREFKEKFATCTNSNINQIPIRFPSYENKDVSALLMKCTEKIFHGKDEGMELALRLKQQLLRVDNSIRYDLPKNIAFAGGNTKLIGFDDQFIDELENLYEHDFEIINPRVRDRDLLIWIGGSLLASLQLVSAAFYTREEYDESGPLGYRRRHF